MKKIILYILLFACLNVNAKRKVTAEVEDTNTKTMVTIGIAADKNEAITLALKQAIEQSFGTFVSANTNIINDELTRDEVVSVSSGNIRNYKELASSQLENGKWSVTLESEVSITKLINFAQTKGDICELSGNVIAQQIKYNKLVQKNTQVVMDNLYEQLKSMINNCFDKTIDAKPSINVDKNIIHVNVRFVPNQNWDIFKSSIINTLSSLKLQNKDGIKTQKFILYLQGDKKEFEIADCNVKFLELEDEFLDYINRFCVEDNLGNKIPIATKRSLFNSFYVDGGEYKIGGVCYIDEKFNWECTGIGIENTWHLDFDRSFKGYAKYNLSLDDLEKFNKVEIKETALDYFPCTNIYSILSNNEFVALKEGSSSINYKRLCPHFLRVFGLEPVTQFGEPVYRNGQKLLRMCGPGELADPFKGSEKKDIYIRAQKSCYGNKEYGTYMKLSDFLHLNEEELRAALSAISSCDGIEYKKNTAKKK